MLWDIHVVPHGRGNDVPALLDANQRVDAEQVRGDARGQDLRLPLVARQREEQVRSAQLPHHVHRVRPLLAEEGCGPRNFPEHRVSLLLCRLWARRIARADVDRRGPADLLPEPCLQQVEGIVWVLLEGRVEAGKAPRDVVGELALLRAPARPGREQVREDRGLHVHTNLRGSLRLFDLLDRRSRWRRAARREVRRVHLALLECFGFLCLRHRPLLALLDLGNERFEELLDARLHCIIPVARMVLQEILESVPDLGGAHRNGGAGHASADAAPQDALHDVNVVAFEDLTSPRRVQGRDERASALRQRAALGHVDEDGVRLPQC